MKVHRVVIIIIYLVCIHQATCLFEPVSLTVAASALGAGLYYGYSQVKCSYQECCNNEYIPKKITGKLK